MRYLLLACVCLIAVAECSKKSHGKVIRRRCCLGEACYPSHETLCKLRGTLTGSLILPADVDYRDAVLMNNRRITGYPGFVVVAMSTKDVSLAMKFAYKHNLEVSIKYDNIDPTGRSTNDGGMVIDMSQWKNQSHVVTSERSAAGEITVNAGNTWGEVYTYVDTITTLRSDSSLLRRIIAGSRYNQESVGRFTQSGGVGPLSRNIGLAVDNLLEATVVTVSGKVVKVSSAGVYYHTETGWSHKYKNTDLFYAVRGGGSGTFGVVLSLTFRLHFAPVDMNQFQSEHVLHRSGQFVGKPALKNFLVAVKALDKVFGVELMTSSGNRVTPEREGSIDWSILQSFDITSAFSATGSGLVTDNSTGTLLAGNGETARPTYLDFSSSIPDVTPANGYIISTFVQPEVVDDPEKLDKLADLFLSVVNVPTVDSKINCRGVVLGGAISSVPASSTAVNPLIRSAFMMVTCSVTWPENGDCDDEIFREAVEDLEDKMEDIGRGAYFNDAGEDLSNWKTAIFGPNYRKLVDVKRMWDSDNFLFCENCVGSDFRFDCFENHKLEGLQLSSYLYYSSCGHMFYG